MPAEVIEMAQSWPRILLVACSALLAAGCSTTQSPAPSPPTVGPATAVPPNQAALSVYREFWRITDAARAAPTAQDWKPKIEAVATGQALDTALADVENYASLPAHVVGTITRDPRVVDVRPGRVAIKDCVDLGTVRLISDKTGKRLDDAKNRVQRYQLSAVVLADGAGQWRVDTAEPALDQKC